MEAHCENACAIAEFLDGHPAVEKVFFPGLGERPGHEIAARQMRDFGGRGSFLAPTEEDAIGLVARAKLFTLAESFGGVERLNEGPARITHGSTADAPFAPPWNLVRLSGASRAADDLV